MIGGLAATPATRAHGSGASARRLRLRGASSLAHVAVCAAFGAACVACTPDPAQQAPWEWTLPPGFPEPALPDDMVMTAEKIALGRALFHDRRLSGNGMQSCADCHDQALAFADGLPTAVGSTGEIHPRNSQSLGNVVYFNHLTWADPTLDDLRQQILIPLFGEQPLELGVGGQELVVLDRLAAEGEYVALFDAAYGTPVGDIDFDQVADALAVFCATLITGRSAYDRWAYDGQEGALSAAAKRGMSAFFAEDLECHHCHGGFNFAVATTHEGAAEPPAAFHNTGLYDVDGTGSYPVGNQGLYERTGLDADRGRFRAPSLRNVVLTAPYAHDGTVATLPEMLEIYAAGGRVIPVGEPNAGDGRDNPNKSAFIHGFPLDAAAQADVIAFLEALTDEAFVADPAHASPW